MFFVNTDSWGQEKWLLIIRRISQSQNTQMVRSNILKIDASYI